VSANVRSEVGCIQTLSTSQPRSLIIFRHSLHTSWNCVNILSHLHSTVVQNTFRSYLQRCW
jgi:hypothetical protein